MQHQRYAEEQGLLGSLCPGQKKLEGKTFYLDSVKKRSTALLLEAVSLLGGRVESFLHKDVSFVVSGSQESLKEQNCKDTKAGVKGTSDKGIKRPIMQRESVLSSDKPRPGTPRPVACGSRGKALLEKAMRNNERLQASSALANARLWGVKILYVDDVLLYLKQLTRDSFSSAYKKQEKTTTKQQGERIVKAAALRSPYLKIEDLSRRYKPLHMQSMTFPTLCYSGRFSPFESPPPRFEKSAEPEEKKIREKKKVESSLQDKNEMPLSCNPSPWRPRKKDQSYCECCNQPFANLEEHLQSDQHRAFVLDPSNYSVVDQLVTEMFPGFDPNPVQQLDETLNRPPTPLSSCDLAPLTDAETEHAVQALQRPGSAFHIHISSPTRGPLSSPSPEAPLPIPNLPTTPAADIQLLPANTDCQQLFDSCPRVSSPAMPLLDVEPQSSATLQPDTQRLSPSPDPYSLPPVLSPQVPYTTHSMAPHHLHSDPPVLSPQWCPAEEAVQGHTCEMDTAESVSQSVPCPIPTTHSQSVFLTNTEGLNGSNQEELLGFNDIVCRTSVLEHAKLLSRRSRSFPRQLETAPNLKKRCRSASPERSRSKRRRTTVDLGCSDSWTEQRDTSTKLECDFMAKLEGHLLFDKVSQSSPNPKASSTCTVKTLDSKPTMFCVPTAQNFTQAPHHMGALCDHPARPHSSKTKACDPPLLPPHDKSHSAVSSQDSQRSVSHSTSVCIESALIPDMAMFSSSSSDSDWDCGLLSRLGPTSAAPLSPAEQSCDKDLLRTPCTWTHDTSYESRLHTALQPSTPATSLCGEEMDPSAFSRTVVQIVEVQH